MHHSPKKPGRRLFVQALAATAVPGALLPGMAHAASKENAWASSYTPYAGPFNAAFNGELQAANLKIDGKLPAGLRGTLFRNGPGRLQVGATTLRHRFDGDAMLQAFRLADGKASHRGAMVRTPKLLEEEAAGRFLYPGYSDGNYSDAKPIRSPNMLNVANINVLPMNDGRDLYALWEGGSATQVDPQSLATIGFKDWSPESAGAPFSAHPRVSPDGTVWSNGYLPGSGKLMLYEIAANGRLKRQAVLDVPQADMLHDFAITERYLVFLLQPLNFGESERPGQSILDRYRWRYDAPLIALLVDKKDFSTRRFDLPNGGFFHMGNAWEEKGTVRLSYARHSHILDAMQHLHLGDSEDPKRHYPSWMEIELNLASGHATQHAMGLDRIEFPRFDQRFTGRQTNLTILMQRTAAMTAGVHGYNAVVTLRKGKVDRYAYGAGTIAEEHLYVPVAGAKEGSGWILGTSYHWPTERTTLSVFDAQAVQAGPIAQVRLPYGLPLGIHGQFVAA